MKKTKVAVIGCGNIARSAHVPNYRKNPNAEIAYLIDIIPERAKELKEKFECENAVVLTDYKKMLRDETVDCVSVCVPNGLHEPISTRCLAAGKNVLCEKPASVNYRLALKMKKAADESGKILNIGVVNRFKHSVNMIKDMIASGELGEVYQIYCSFRAFRAIPGLGGPFTTKALSGGGVLIDWGVHFLDLIDYITGSPAVKSVSCAQHSRLGSDMKGYVYRDMWAGPPKFDGVYDVEEYVTGIIRTEGPVITFNGAWAQNIDEDAMFVEFMGTKAGIKLSYYGGFTIYSVKNGELTQEKPEIPEGSMFYDELDAFIKSAQTGEKIRSNIDYVLPTARLMDAIYRSAEKGAEVVFK